VLKGIDVSSHQGTINWGAVDRSAMQFVMLRLGIGKMENAPSLDKQFRYNADTLTARGIPWGCYIYSYANDIGDVKADAEFAINELKAYKGKMEYPIFYDVEEARQFAYGAATMCAWVECFCDTLRAAGWLSGVYCNENWRANRIKGIQDKYPLWLAHYGVSKPKWDGAAIWQYTEKGGVGGFKGNIDCNYGYVDFPAIVREGGWNGFTATGVPNTPLVTPPDTSNTPTTPVPPDPDPTARTLRQGVAGADVLALAKDLDAEGFLPMLGFDASMKLCVMAYQSERGLDADGEVGPKTRAALAADRARREAAGA